MNGIYSDNNTLDRFTVFIITFTMGFVLGVVTGYRSAPSTPVEEITNVDSLVKINNRVKLKVEKLDSIKDAKVIEVSSLDNDSTVKLFYKLVSE